MNTFTLTAGSKDRDCSESEQPRLIMRDCDRNDAGCADTHGIVFPLRDQRKGTTAPHQPTRRTVLLGAIAAVAPRISLGQTKTVRFGVRTPLPDVSLHEKARLLRRLGFDGIELGTEWTNQSAVEILSQIEGTGIAVSAIVGSLELLNVDPEKRRRAVQLDRRELGKARQVGADSVIEVPAFGPNKFADLSPFLTANEVEEQLLIAELKQLADECQAHGRHSSA